MKITGLNVHQVDLPLHEGNYSWSEGKSVDVFDSTVVVVETDSDITGTGEVCPLGPVYLPAYASGARAGLQELGPQLLGEDPTQLVKLNRTMDRVLKGHPYVKSAVDMACWDILGKVADLPVCSLLGGRYGEDVVLYRAISHLAHSTPTEYLFTSTDFNSYVTQSIADGAPHRVNGRMSASTDPGLGIQPKLDVLGDPVWECRL